MEIKLKKIEMYQLTLPSGKTLDLKKISTWNQMTEFQDGDGNKLICVENRLEVIDSLLGMESNYEVIKANYKLIEELQKV